MTIAFWCVFAGALLHVLTKGPVAARLFQSADGYDNNYPRDQMVRLQGWGRRALAAHQNQIEAFGLFAAGVVIAHIGGADQGTADALALGWVGSRLLYWLCYLCDWSTARSVIWSVGYGASLALICSPAWTAAG